MPSYYLQQFLATLEELQNLKVTRVCDPDDKDKTLLLGFYDGEKHCIQPFKTTYPRIHQELSRIRSYIELEAKTPGNTQKLENLLKQIISRIKPIRDHMVMVDIPVWQVLQKPAARNIVFVNDIKNGIASFAEKVAALQALIDKFKYADDESKISIVAQFDAALAEVIVMPIPKLYNTVTNEPNYTALKAQPLETPWIDKQSDEYARYRNQHNSIRIAFERGRTEEVLLEMHLHLASLQQMLKSMEARDVAIANACYYYNSTYDHIFSQFPSSKFCKYDYVPKTARDFHKTLQKLVQLKAKYKKDPTLEKPNKLVNTAPSSNTSPTPQP